jgi:hypothetical protein
MTTAMTTTLYTVTDDISTVEETTYEHKMNDTGETTYAFKTGETRDVSTTGLSYSLIPTEHIDTSTEELEAPKCPLPKVIFVRHINTLTNKCIGTS